MKKSNIVFYLEDLGGRRSGIDRRNFSYSSCIPERRSKEDRRRNEDRRSGIDRRSVRDQLSGFEDQRSEEDRRIAWNLDLSKAISG